MNMKTILRVTSGILAVLSLLLVVLRMYALSASDMLGSATITHTMGLLFPLSLALLFGYMAIKGRMPGMDEPEKSPPEDPQQDSR